MTSPKTLSILFVDDETDVEPMVRMKLRREVRRGTYDIAFATDGRDALEQLSLDPRPIVVTDLNMPRMGGLDLLERLATEHPSVRAVVVSAYGDLENVRGARERGAVDFLSKPLDFTDLRAILDRLANAPADAPSAPDPDSEAGIAARVRAEVLARTLPETPDLALAARLLPAPASGGDLYEAIALEPGRLGLVVATVPGHGLAAVINLLTVRPILRASLLGAADPQEALAETARALSRDGDLGATLRATVATVNGPTGTVEWATAGAEPPWIATPDGARPLAPRPEPAIPLPEGPPTPTAGANLPRGGALALLSPGTAHAPEAVRAILERGPWEAAHLAPALAAAPTGGGSRDDATALVASRRHP